MPETVFWSIPIFCSNGCFQATSISPFMTRLNDPSVFSIVDSKVPKANAVSVTLEVASSAHDNTHMSQFRMNLTGCHTFDISKAVGIT